MAAYIRNKEDILVEYKLLGEEWFNLLVGSFTTFKVTPTTSADTPHIVLHCACRACGSTKTSVIPEKSQDFLEDMVIFMQDHKDCIMQDTPTTTTPKTTRWQRLMSWLEEEYIVPRYVLIMFFLVIAVLWTSILIKSLGE